MAIVPMLTGMGARGCIAGCLLFIYYPALRQGRGRRDRVDTFVGLGGDLAAERSSARRREPIID